MKLAAESQAHVERFLGEHLNDGELRLPPILIYSGWWTTVLMRALNISAMTLGRRILVAPFQVRQDGQGRKTMPGWLVVHEATHVWQYEREGAARFLVTYLRGYWRLLRASGRWDGAARRGAYLALPEEKAARRAEQAYRQRQSDTMLLLKLERVNE